MIDSRISLTQGAFWTFLGQILYMIIGLAGNVVLARLLRPEDFGLLGIAMFFVGIASVLIDSGMGGALIRKDNINDSDYSTMFLFNLSISLILCILINIFSKYISYIYNAPALANVLSFLSLVLIFNALMLTQTVKLTRAMDFKSISIYKLLALVLATITGILLAFFGFGIWAIVGLQVCNSFILMLIFFFRVGGFGKIIFCKKAFKEMFSFGIFTTLSSIFISIFDNSYQLIIGKKFGIIQTGYYYQAKRLQDVVEAPTRIVLYGPVYSFFCKLKSDINKFNEIHYDISSVINILLAFLTGFIVIFSDRIISIILGDKWMFSSFYLMLLSISSYFSLSEIVQSNLFRVFNKTKNIFHVELFKKSIQAITIFVGIIKQDIYLLLYGLILTSFIGYITTLYISSKLTCTSFINNLKSFVSVSMIAIVTSTIIFYFKKFFASNFYLDVLFFISYFTLFLILLFIMRTKEFNYIKKYIVSRL